MKTMTLLFAPIVLPMPTQSSGGGQVTWPEGLLIVFGSLLFIWIAIMLMVWITDTAEGGNLTLVEILKAQWRVIKRLRLR